MHRPSKRLLYDINIFEEEVKIIPTVMKEQHGRLHEYSTVMAPDSFRVTSHSRLSLFGLEYPLLQKTIQQHQLESGHHDNLILSAPQLAK